MSGCQTSVVVAELGCSVVQVASAGPQGIQGEAGNASFTEPSTVAALPNASQGARSFVNDSSVTDFNSPVSGGGTFAVPVFFDGIIWRVG